MNASFLEIVQTIASGLGALLAVRSMVAADLNLVAILRRNVNGNRRMVASKNVRVERCVLSTQVMLFLVGLATLFLAPPPYTPVPEGTPRSTIETDMIRNLAITRLGMTTASLVLMYLSYRSWLEERIPIQLARRTDRAVTEIDSVAGAANASLAVVAQQAASQAQVVAAVAQDSASAAQNTATLAQDVATDAHAAATEDTPSDKAT